MISEFSERPFTLGSLTGIRAFSVSPDNRLCGVVHRLPWTPGENEAVCDTQPNTFAYAMQMITRAINGEADFDPSVPHRVATKPCTCGYYAYFNGTNVPQHTPGTVLGLIQGYGLVTVGSKGFRAEKARILAVIDDSGVRWWKRASKFFWFVALAYLAYAILITSAVLGRSHLAASIDAGSIIGWSLWLKMGPHPVLIEPDALAISKAVLARYPDVPVYKSTAAALDDFPLTPVDGDPA